jgi:hypothetical protein
VGTSTFFDLRPAWLPAAVRSYAPSMTANVIHRASTREFQEAHLEVRPLSLQWQTAASASLGVELAWQRLDVPFTLVPGIQVPVGDYAYTRATMALGSNPASALAWTFSGSAGRYFNGVLARAEGSATWTPDARVAVRLSYTPNQFLEYGDSATRGTTHLVAPELRLALNPRLQVTSFYQYNTAVRQGSLNVRGAWEFAPLSFLYVVWNSRREIAGLPAARGSVPADQLTIKAVYLFRR